MATSADWVSEWQAAQGGKAAAPSTPASSDWVNEWNAARSKAGITRPTNPAEGSATLPFGPWNTGIPIPGWLNRGLAGAGEYPVNLWRGLEERAGKVTPQQIAQDQKLDAPLNATTAGKVGNFLGGVGTTAPAMLIPGLNTVAGGAALGAGLGFLTPTTNGRQTLENTALGGITGGAGTALGNKLAGWATGALARRSQAAADEASLNAERDAVLARARGKGYVVPPTAVRPNAVNTALESISGKAATRQGAEAVNQEATNQGVREDLGLPANRPITRAALSGARAKAGGAYKAVEGVGTIPSDQAYQDAISKLAQTGVDLEGKYPGIGAQANPQIQELVKSLSVPEHTGESAVALSKLLRNRASANFRAAFQQGGNPQALELAHAQKGAADAVEELVQRHLENGGQGDLAKAWKAARTTIAKAHQAQAALKGNNISAIKLATQAGKAPMTGNMGLAADFAGQFPEVSRLPKSGVGVSKLGAAMSLAEALLGGGGAAYLHSPELALGTGAVAAGTALAPYAARKAILGGLGQRLLANPNYSPGMLGTGILQAIRAAGYPALQRAAIPAALQLAGPQ